MDERGRNASGTQGATPCVGMAVFHDEDGEDISLRLIDHYKDYADIFSEEKIHALPEHSKYDHKIDVTTIVVTELIEYQ